MPTDEHTPETRRKRAKIVSACGECRRKKTKCNGEHPCRNCEKSAVPCVYPSSNADDKRNAHSKVALEAIEERLKAIEDMLRTILQSHISAADLDPVAVNNFLNPDKSLSSSPVSPPSPAQLPPPPPPQQSSSDLRLPSIHNLSAPTPAYPQQPADIKHEPRNLPYPHYMSYGDNDPRDGDRDIHANR
ncbi:hypothetical protein DFQ28_004127 [Apophysomyces sp. BC1034]|nr:hypothetical protein DFQ30_004102 [Apophysomyces sp. BC1015]KAG0178622.1 hypothetical protein DFQ29_003225 [Apophysomyces sp. BC1021]KAG0188947.1 hypothetical protein DFQ28_004127 [Apophysomyces sp. BC1034]